MAKRQSTRPPAQRRVVGRASRPAPARAAGPLGDRSNLAKYLVGGVVGVLLVGVVVVALFANSGSPYNCAQRVQPVPGATVENPIVVASEGVRHVQAGTRTSYLNCPPSSGPHYNQAGIAPLQPAFYGPESGVGPANWLHNLEHGFVVAAYRCENGTCPDDDTLERLRDFVLDGPNTPSATACGYESKVLAARFDAMDAPFAMLAWEHVLLMDEFDLETALDFAETWIEQETLPERNSC